MKYIHLLLISLISQFCLAQLPVSIGNFKGISSDVENEKYITKVSVEAENAFLTLTPYSQTVVRVRATNKLFLSDMSYAVVQTPSTDAYFSYMKEEGNFWVLKTDSITIKIQKNPVRLAFYNYKGEILNEDESAFGVNWMGTEVTCYKKLQEGERFLGLGEKTGNLDRRGSAFENWNTDDYGYEAGADPLYCTTPFYTGFHHNRFYGIFFDNSYKSTFNFGASNDRYSAFSAVDGEMNYYFFGGNSLPQILQDYTRLTGRMDMPPLWSLGFQQCRWSYFPDKEVQNLAQTFRDKNFGADVIYLDINYMDAYKIFTFHPKDFSAPKKLTDDLKKLGFHVVTIVDPGIKVEKGYKQYEEGIKQDLFVKYPDNERYKGQVWPGWCHFPDFTKKATREWWGKSFQTYTDVGIEGFWNDMNEPATWGQNFPNHVLFDWDGQKSTHRQAHNVYGLEMARSTYEGSKKLLNGKRPFSLTRAAYSGIQRYSAVWTGDNVASDEHLMTSVRLLNSMSLAGIPFVGADVGGFSGNCTPDLYLRWMSIGAYTPFFRAHSQWNSTEHEPWSWGEDTERETRKIIAKRYKMLPYLYSLFYEAHTSGLPIMRPVAFHYPYDEKSFYYQFENQFLCGKNILVAPVESNQKFQKVYLPKGSNWFHIDTDEKFEGGKEVIVDAPLSQLPVFVQGGSIIPLQKPTLSTMFPVSDTLELHIYAGTKPEVFSYYEDDGATFNYEKGNFYKRNFSFDNEKKELIMSKKEGTFPSKFKHYELIFHGFDAISAINVEGKSVAVKNNSVVVEVK